MRFDKKGSRVFSRTRALTAIVGLSWSAGCAPASDPPSDPTVLMEADRAFAAAVAEGGSEAWASWFADDGVSLHWEPLRADIAASGDLGWTTGTYLSEARGEDGTVNRGEGRYVSIWRLQEDGSWKVVMDLGNPTGSPPEGG
jgi:ketosteroid isomerase-like protein